MDFAYYIKSILLGLPGILFALTIHEYAHGWVAYRFGDPTPKMAGRLTLNPLPHLDPIGTLLIVFARFGWAKPVPINPMYFTDRKKGIIWTSLAGCIANILSALVFGIMLRLILPYIQGSGNLGIDILYMILFYAMFINLILAFFNLIPIPPLDGSKVLMMLLPRDSAIRFAQLERWGPMILIFVIFLGSITGFGILRLIIFPPVSLFCYIFTGHSLEYLWRVYSVLLL